MDAVGNINGVPAYEFDLDGLKVEDKPWRKPGINFMLCYVLSLLLIFRSAKRAGSKIVLSLSVEGFCHKLVDGFL